MNILAVLSHPDDEVLGCGGVLARHAVADDKVDVSIFTNGVGARGWKRGAADARKTEWHNACRTLGAGAMIPPDVFSDQQLDRVSMLELAQVVERTLEKSRPEIVYTHWLGDLNLDHRLVAQAVLTATRPAAGSRVRRVLACEIPESTSQGFGFMSFEPNVYVDIGGYLKTKLEALRCYESERRESPHLRSAQGVVTCAGLRGGEAGCDFAEAFVLMREVMR